MEQYVHLIGGETSNFYIQVQKKIQKGTCLLQVGKPQICLHRFLYLLSKYRKKYRNIRISFKYENLKFVYISSYTYYSSIDKNIEKIRPSCRLKNKFVYPNIVKKLYKVRTIPYKWERANLMEAGFSLYNRPKRAENTPG